MDFNILNQIQPRINIVVNRDTPFWELSQYQIFKHPTQYNNLAYVYTGKGSIELDQKTDVLVAGTLFLFSPGKRMLIKSTSARPLGFYSVQFRYGLLEWKDEIGEWTNQPTAVLPFPEIMSGDNHTIIEDMFARMFTVSPINYIARYMLF